MKKALFLIFDFEYWQEARSWSYASSYLLFQESKAFLKSDIQVIRHRAVKTDNAKLVASIPDGTYDWIFVWHPHAALNETVIKTLGKKCSVLCHVLVESLLYSGAEIWEMPHLANRWPHCEALFRSCANAVVLSFCPESAQRLNEVNIPTVATFGIKPKDIAFIQQRVGVDECVVRMKYSIAGKLYNAKRRGVFDQLHQVLDSQGLKELAVQEDYSLHERFQALMVCLETMPVDCFRQRSVIAQDIALVRHHIWLQYLKSIMEAHWVVSLPSYFKGLPARVLEGALVGTKVAIFCQEEGRTATHISDAISPYLLPVATGFASLAGDGLSTCTVGPDVLSAFDDFECVVEQLSSHFDESKCRNKRAVAVG